MSAELEPKVPIDPNFTRVLYQRTTEDDSAIGPDFLANYVPGRLF